MEPSGRITRIRDPIHDLITFDPEDRRDQLALKLVNSREFQRLRRIKQLGFSEMVFPGATHTRFSHCLGAFFIARKLLKIVEEKTEEYDKEKAFVAAIAALLHDIGHGPFSHVFEGIQKELGIEKRHEAWGSDIVEGETEIRALLDECDKSLAQKVALLLSKRDPADIYDSVVSSQFDADRLDYLQRDRYMSGTKTGAFDFAWLLDCLEIGKITVGQGGDYLSVDGFYLGNKGLAAAEGYLLARFHLYSQVYLHKTTRSAERMLAALLRRLGELVKSDGVAKTGLDQRHPLLGLFENDLHSYLQLDDPSIWSGISQMADAEDTTTRDLAIRIRDRHLYKCFDAGELARTKGKQSLPNFKMGLKEICEEFGAGVVTDEAMLTAYGIHEYEDPGALQKVLIGQPDDSGPPDDIVERSPIIKSIDRKRIFRVYCGEPAGMERVRQVWREVTK